MKKIPNKDELAAKNKNKTSQKKYSKVIKMVKNNNGPTAKHTPLSAPKSERKKLITLNGILIVRAKEH